MPNGQPECCHSEHEQSAEFRTNTSV
ncbi:hypothetical protein V12B01_13095 [Vibrio splendidus 12B01]|nr:hypothetical protein V12B01_13095 [Vibrio splendidus 12B01]